MMKRLYLVTTALFWAAVVGFWAAVPAAVEPARAAPAPAVASSPIVSKPSPKTFTLAEVARHRTAGDCWMVIDGQVHDVTAYVPKHPAETEVLTAWCGREATQAYRTKMESRPHSARADRMLPTYRIGSVASAP